MLCLTPHFDNRQCSQFVKNRGWTATPHAQVTPVISYLIQTCKAHNFLSPFSDYSQSSKFSQQIEHWCQNYFSKISLLDLKLKNFEKNLHYLCQIVAYLWVSNDSFRLWCYIKSNYIGLGFHNKSRKVDHFLLLNNPKRFHDLFNVLPFRIFSLSCLW